MKRAIELLSIAFLCFSCTQLKYLEPYNGYKGKPRTVESTTYRVPGKGDTVNEKLRFGDIHLFDLKGRIIKHETYGSDSVRNGWWIHVYDKNGSIIQNKIYRSDSSVSVVNNYQFNKYGQEILREYVSGGNKAITKSTYDRKMKEVTVEGYRNDGSFNEKTIIYYDDQWREVEIKSYFQTGKLKTRIEKAYDQNGNNILSRWYDSNNELYEFYKTGFNENKHRTSIEKYRVKNGDTTLIQETKMTYRYDARGNIIYESIGSNEANSWITRTRFIY
jgi:hypothetical protein